MKITLSSVLLLAFAVSLLSSAQAQDHRITRYEREPNYLSFRFGTWFPKDDEKAFKFEDISYDDTQGKIDQGQAIGIELEYQNLISAPIYMDFAMGGWYSSYTFEKTDLISNPDLVRDADAWAAVVPVTLGLSFHPLQRSILQPYAMAGGGAYFGFTGHTLALGTERQVDESKNQIVFGWFVGAGFDFLFSPGLGASLAAKYNFVEFDEPFFTGQKDMSGLTISIGITVARANID
jgi:opacity protein-like surface antigen